MAYATLEVTTLSDRSLRPDLDESATDGAPETAPDAPYGAIAVTAFLAATILVFWFGMFALNLTRS